MESIADHVQRITPCWLIGGGAGAIASPVINCMHVDETPHAQACGGVTKVVICVLFTCQALLEIVQCDREHVREEIQDAVIVVSWHLVGLILVCIP